MVDHFEFTPTTSPPASKINFPDIASATTYMTFGKLLCSSSIIVSDAVAANKTWEEALHGQEHAAYTKKKNCRPSLVPFLVVSLEIWSKMKPSMRGEAFNYVGNPLQEVLGKGDESTPEPVTQNVKFGTRTKGTNTFRTREI